MRKWEFEVLVVELRNVGTTALRIRNDLNLDNLYGGSTSTMAGSHFTVELGHSTFLGKVTVLLVHVMSSRSGIVTDPDAIVSDNERLLWVNLKLKILGYSIKECN